MTPKIYTWNQLNIGNSFIYKGNYCTVIKILDNSFVYKIQNSNVIGYMSFKHYTTTPSFKTKNKKN